MGEVREKVTESMNRPKVLYVMVAYGCKYDESQAWKSLLHDRARVFVYDNSAQSPEVTAIGESGVYIGDPSNPGLSRAYNRAAEYAEENGYEWLVLTDQDTIYPPGAASRYEELPIRFPEEKLFVPRVRISDGRYMSPLALRHYMPVLSGHPLTGRILLREAAVINSGMMVNVEAFRKCGGYNEKVFLDFSDYQFIDRLSRNVEYGIVTDEVVTQGFSRMDDDKETGLMRFRLFCRSLCGYESRGWRQWMDLWMVRIRRTISLSVGRRSLRPFSILIKESFFPGNNISKPLINKQISCEGREENKTSKEKE